MSWPGPDVVLLRGPSGVGKTSVARALATALDGGAVVEVDAVRGCMVRLD